MAELIGVLGWVLLGLVLLLAVIAWQLLRRARVKLEESLEDTRAMLERERREVERLRDESSRFTMAAAADLRESALATAELETEIEELQNAAEAKARFFANVSHELRTPLTLIISPLEDIRDGLHGTLSPTAQTQIALAVRSGNKLIHLVNQILALARVEAGRVEVRLRRADLIAQAREVAASFASVAIGKKLDLQVELPREPVVFFFDRDIIDRIVVNLLSNAVKFTPPSGTVRLTVEVKEASSSDPSGLGEVRVCVRDSGPGIPAPELPLIFDRFYQVESRRSAEPGIGIGLSLVKELSELHGGRVEVDSLEGFGAEFVVSLPLLRDRSMDEGSSFGVAFARRSREGGAPWRERDFRVERDSSMSVVDPEGESDRTTVLIVDDDVDLRSYIRSRLEPTYLTLEAADGEEGLEVARRSLPDIVVSDVVMPRVDGYELCRAMTGDPELSGIPVVLLTGRVDNSDRIEGLESGADAYLAKPFEVRELEAQIENLIESRKRLREQITPRRSIEASPVEVVSVDDRFLERVKSAVESQMGDEDFSVEGLASELAMSRGHLHRRLRETSGKTPAMVIRTLRLQKAAQLLAGRAGSVSEVAYGVGFKSLAHFSKSFKDEYGMTPSAYMARGDGS